MPTTLLRCCLCGLRVPPVEAVYVGARPAHSGCADVWYRDLDVLTERRTL